MINRILYLQLLLVISWHLDAQQQSISTNTSFSTEEITFTNGKIKLAGTIFIPHTKDPSPAIAITHGSSRDSKSHTGFISLASLLARNGYVTLIFDKRGVGSSSGEYIETPEMTLPAGDLVQAVNFLKSRKEVNKLKIGVYGHSQGGWVAPLASTICKDIAFVMVACGGGLSIREQVLINLSLDLKSKNYSLATMDSIVTFGRQLYTYLGTGLEYARTNSAYTDAVKKNWFSIFRQMQFGDRLPPPSMLKEPSFNFFKTINYDPQSTLRAIDVPTLVILAGKDTIVPFEKSKQIWEDSFYASGQSKMLTIAVLPDEDHYDFERIDDSVAYKKSYESSLMDWLLRLNMK